MPDIENLTTFQVVSKHVVSPGMVFGRLTVLSKDGSDDSFMWKCRCSCGRERIIYKYSLTNGVTRSCGCLRTETTISRSSRHGFCPRGKVSSTYRVWTHIKGRCFNPTDSAYANYGGRGITMCPEWEASFETFLADMGPKPPRLTIDRVNNDGNYEPSNCRWATPKE